MPPPPRTTPLQTISAALATCLLAAVGCSDDDPAGSDPAGASSAEALLRSRQQLDETVWADEVEAGQREAAFVDLWDAIRAADDKFAPLAEFRFAQLTLPSAPASVQATDLDVELLHFAAADQTLSPAEWRSRIDRWKARGWRVVQTDWHHSRFTPADNAGAAPGSEIHFNIHAIRPAGQTAAMLHGLLRVSWTDPPSLEVAELRAARRTGGGFFRPIFTEQHGDGQFATSHPLLVFDLDGDGLSEVLLPRWNRVLRNRGGLEFDRRPLLAHPLPLWEAALVSDFDGDRVPDLLAIAKDGYPHLFRGSAGGRFESPAERCADTEFNLPSVLTAGDIDGDGDLDVWATQYRLSFEGGQMPTPYYDANDGHPSYLLRNDGGGRFTDITEAAGLAPLRHRRTYSASFIDLDGDGDLDLVNTADYAGVDLYRNDGGGTFELATGDWIGERHSFGMGNTFADYDGDGRLDLYVIGMSSTTARRLDRLGLGRDDRPAVHQKRAAMGYGNRLYFGAGNRFEERPAVAPSVARTGWSWGVTSTDFDLDGDRDIYVANGYRSGASSRDYCTNFWRHDIYTGDSDTDPAIQSLFRSELADLNRNAMSWNGYEKNPLLLNALGGLGRFVDVGFLLGVGFGYDARAVVADDLDADGRPDLLVSRSIFDGRGFITELHAYRNELALPAGRSWIALDAGTSGASSAQLMLADGSVRSHWFVTGDSFAAQHAATAHFGLPAGARPVRFTVRWPGGRSLTIPAPEAGKRYLVPTR